MAKNNSLALFVKYGEAQGATELIVCTTAGVSFLGTGALE